MPPLARLADALCLALVVLALIIYGSGGFRERLFGIRIALTSPGRMLLWALALAIVRHVWVRQRPIYADLPRRLAAAWHTPAVRTALTAFAGTRPAILFVGYIAIFMVGFPSGQVPPWRVSENEFGNLPARWDVGWYLGIASSGYSYSLHAQEAGDQQSIVFFQAGPIVMRVAGRLIGASSTDYMLYVWGGTLASLGAFLLALTYLFRFARDVLEDEDQAGLSVWLLSTYPFALWFCTPYTESLFLLGAVGAFYHARRGELWKSGAWGLLVGLSRPNGCFLSLPLAILALEPSLPAWIAGGPRLKARESAGLTNDALPASRPAVAGSSEARSWRQLVTRIAAAAMPGVGMLIYSAYIWQLTTDPLAWAKGHVAWGRSYQGLSILVTERYAWLENVGLYRYTSEASNDLLQLMGAVFVLVAAWPVARRIGLACSVFILINMLPPLAAGGLLSAGRFSSVLFPAFVWLASALPARQRSAWLATFMALQALNAILFFTWREMF